MKDRLVLAGATVLGLGYFPKGPGTAGSLGALLLFSWTGVSWWMAAVLFFAGVWIAQQAEVLLAEHDPAQVVIDEVAGMAAALWSLQGWWPLFGAFLCFRLFDIWKPWPVGSLQKLPGGWGVMADDLAAGLMANGVIHLVLCFIPWR